MLNKKVLVAAIAASFTTSALAADTSIDLNDTNAAGAEVANTVVVANESFSSSDLNSNGTLTVANVNNELDLVTDAGFTIVAGTTKYVRVDVVNGAFGGNVSLTGTNVATSINSQGGTAGDNFVVIEVEASATKPIAVDDRLTIVANGYIATPGTTVTLKYSLYETGAGAVNELESDLLYSDQEAAIAFADATAGEFVDANTLTATVSSGFTQYTSGATGLLATVDTATLIKKGSFIAPDGSAFTSDDLLTNTTQDITFTGDFSFGTWSLSAGTACGANSAGLAVAADKASATASSVALTGGTSYALCNELTVDEDVAKKGTYSAELEDGFTDDSGVIEYDTLSIEVPYITTFADYNQRIYIVNNGSSEAFYTMTFTSEDGVTATPKAAAAGTVPAGEMVMLKATDVVELTGKTRTSAVIEIEAEDANVSATMQTVNNRDGNGTTDTVVLN